jgi:hypothetical protein
MKAAICLFIKYIENWGSRTRHMAGEYWMVYRGPDFLAGRMIWYLAPNPHLPSVSSTGDKREDWEREPTCWRERVEKGVGEEPNHPNHPKTAWPSINHSILSGHMSCPAASVFYIFDKKTNSKCYTWLLYICIKTWWLPMDMKNCCINYRFPISDRAEPTAHYFSASIIFIYSAICL